MSNLPPWNGWRGLPAWLNRWPHRKHEPNHFARHGRHIDDACRVPGPDIDVRDVELSLAFYLRVPGTTMAGHRQGEFALLEINGCLLGLLQLPKAGFHIELGTEDLDRRYDHLVRKGIKPRSAPRERQWGERTFKVTDPDGHVPEFQAT